MKKRQILFRGKCKITGKWVYGHYYYSSDENAHVIVTINNVGADIKNLEPPATVQIETFVDPETLGQFIGIEDGIPVGIFEGDIVEGELEPHFNLPLGAEPTGEPNKYVGIVTYSGTEWVLTAKGSIYQTAISYLDDLAIVGNIWDTPDLLPVAKGELGKTDGKQLNLFENGKDEDTEGITIFEM